MSADLLKFYLVHPLRLLRQLHQVCWQMPLAYCRQNREIKKINADTENLIVFIVPWKPRPKGGYMSFFSLAAAAKSLKHVHGSEVMMATTVGFRTYFRNSFINSDERVFRFRQIKRFKRLNKLIFHIPEILAAKFYRNLSAVDRRFLAGIRGVQLNILNQNINYMPGAEEIASLKKLTPEITQTTAHDKYASQEICNQYGIPLHHFSVYLDLSPYPRLDFKDTKKTILLSLDKNECRNGIIKTLERGLPDYRLVVVEGMPFSEYMLLVAKSKFSITFGEGFDGYLIHAAVMGRICFAVYNENFFPNDAFKKMGNIYLSYEEMAGNIAGSVRRLESERSAYDMVVRQNMLEINRFYSHDKFMDNQKRFYLRHYDYYPAAAAAPAAATGFDKADAAGR